MWHKQVKTKASARQADRQWHTLHTDIKLAEQILARDDMGDSSFVDSVDNGFLPQCGVQSDHCNTHPLIATAVPEPPNSNCSLLANTAIFLLSNSEIYMVLSQLRRRKHTNLHNHNVAISNTWRLHAAAWEQIHEHMKSHLAAAEPLEFQRKHDDENRKHFQQHLPQLLNTHTPCVSRPKASE